VEHDDARHPVVLSGREEPRERVGVGVECGARELEAREARLLKALVVERELHVNQPAEAAGPGVGAPLRREDLHRDRARATMPVSSLAVVAALGGRPALVPAALRRAVVAAATIPGGAVVASL